ncbi:MAG: S-layer homology domain-containing protein [Candidatus Peribacteria bacterium]|jgi:hypothetical protein|nr:S-layer homology domain-containing protein [Candidatus Peribacteria bacterium]
MKKSNLVLGSVLAVAAFSFSFASATLLQDAIQRGYDQGLTRYNTPSTFMASNSLRRDEASKFFVEFVDTQEYYTDGGTNCAFSDVFKAISDLQSYVKTSCEYGIFNGANGKFLPDQKLTNAQAVAVVVRILNGKLSENGVHRADNYYTRAKELGLDISAFSNKEATTTRGDVMTLLYSAATGEGADDDIVCTSVKQCLDQLQDIMDE